MARLTIAAFAAAASFALMPTAGIAQASNGYYSATPATAPAPGRIVTRSTVWTCGETSCEASKGRSRDAIMCQLIVREVGALTSFSANGQAFDAESLSNCNARARS